MKVFEPPVNKLLFPIRLRMRLMNPSLAAAFAEVELDVLAAVAHDKRPLLVFGRQLGSNR